MQVELRNKVAERKRKEEEYWHKKTMEDLAKGLEEEKRKEEGIRLRAQQAKAVQMAQLEEMRQAYVMCFPRCIFVTSCSGTSP